MAANDAHGYCLDCGKKMSDKWMYKNPFAQEGKSPSCTTCGGVVAVIYEKDAENEISKNQRMRGINRESRATLGDWKEAEEKFDIPAIPVLDDEE